MAALSTDRGGRLGILRALPRAIAELTAPELADALDGPTLFDLRKPHDAPLFISVLLHGNETSGWDAVRRLGDEVSHASVLLFVANVEAARANVRHLPGTPDFNRVWEGGSAPEVAIADEVTAYAEAAGPYLAVDVHNNTGDNPPYAVVTDTEPGTLSVARAFARRALLAAQPKGFLSRRFAAFCTALTVEVGKPDDVESTPRAARFLKRLLVSNGAPTDAFADLALFETTARVFLADGALLDPDMQRYNFCPAPAGTALTRAGALTAEDPDGLDVTDALLDCRDGKAVLKRRTHIAMYTGSERSARQDCLCYLLQPLNDVRHA